MQDDETLSQFFSVPNLELLAKMGRLDKLIGNRHWLSVGTYKENLLKKVLRETVPEKYTISSGFIMARNSEAAIVRSKQTDILIWDSSAYSPIFKDDDFVIVPPEACRVMIEVKGVLTKKEVKRTLDNYDSMTDFYNVQFLQEHDIKKYLFAYDSRAIQFPEGLLGSIAKTYRESEKVSLETRMKAIKQLGWPSPGASWANFLFDGIFVLSKGFVLNSLRQFSDGVHFIVESFSLESKKENNVFTVLENEILTTLGTRSRGNQGMWYMDQPGLLSLRGGTRMKKTEPKNVFVLPESDSLPSDMDSSRVFRVSDL